MPMKGGPTVELSRCECLDLVPASIGFYRRDESASRIRPYLSYKAHGRGIRPGTGVRTIVGAMALSPNAYLQAKI